MGGNNNNYHSNGNRKRRTRESDEEYSPSEKKPRTLVKNEIKDEPMAEMDEKPLKMVIKSEKQSQKADHKTKQEIKDEPKQVKTEETGEKVKWWEQETSRGPGDKKWHFLEHNGPVFSPAYEPLPDHVRFFYDKKPMKLAPSAEEIATFYGRMIDHDYTTRQVFNKNFFKDWRKSMNETD